MGDRVLVRIGSTAVLAATALLALALAAPAMAAKQFPRAEFKVEIDGTQFTDWSYSHTTQGTCEGQTYQTQQTGSGREDFSLTTKKPVKIVATWIKGNGANSVIIGRPNGTIGIPVNVAAIREGTFNTTGGAPPECAVGDGGGGAPPQQPDCGPRSFNSELRMRHVPPDQYFGDPPVPLVDVLVLDGPVDSQGNATMNDQWQNCPGGPGDARFDENTNDGLSKKKLFGKDDKFTAKAKDTRPLTGGYSGQTVSEWKVVFKRVNN